MPAISSAGGVFSTISQHRSFSSTPGHRTSVCQRWVRWKMLQSIGRSRKRMKTHIQFAAFEHPVKSSEIQWNPVSHFWHSRYSRWHRFRGVNCGCVWWQHWHGLCRKSRRKRQLLDVSEYICMDCINQYVKIDKTWWRILIMDYDNRKSL